MANASTLEIMSPQLSKVVERARNEPEGRFHALAHLIDEPVLARAYSRSRKEAAVGVRKRLTWERYVAILSRHPPLPWIKVQVWGR